MKILFIIPAYEPAWAFGGTVTSTVNLCRQLVKLGHDVSVYTTDTDKEGGVLKIKKNILIEMGGVKTWYFECNFGRKHSFYSSKLISHLIKTVNGFEIINISAIWQLLAYKSAKVCRDNNIPFILTPHASLRKDAFFHTGNQIIKKIYWYFFGYPTIKLANAIHFLSEGEREESFRVTNNKKSFIVPNGIKIEKYIIPKSDKFKIRKELNIDEDTLLFLFLGRVHPIKQLNLIIDALPILIEMNISFKFLIVGHIDKNYYDILNNQIIKNNLRDYVIWNNQVDNEKVKYYYSSSDLTLLTSKSEGVSMALIEAMATGTPSLVSNKVANYKEIISDKSGIVVDSSVESIKEALKKIVEGDLDIKKMGLNAFNSAEKRYNINIVAKRMIVAYNDILKKNKSEEIFWKN
ncbi:MAG: hypothetical protein CMC04_07665 [Flavobacteriaceae bacterium]|nr:hypothetical protein [Flavobacteriaceae bacterium]|tara:strand:+ start:23334 stop:24551 length:1218 start_codon:yes stop_codon:yes gene_type:complete